MRRARLTFGDRLGLLRSVFFSIVSLPFLHLTPPLPPSPFPLPLSPPQHTTQTLSSLTWEELGGWGTSFDLFVTNTEQDASEAGYDSKNPSHKLLLWGEGIVGPLGLCLRYIHYFEPCGIKGEAEEITRANEERNGLVARNGDVEKTFRKPIEGLGHIDYF